MRQRQLKGFSLIELAVVIAIISLVVGAGLGLGASALKAADKYAVQERLSLIKTALNQFAQMNGYLPCPADLTQAPSSSSFGAEARTGSTSCSTASGVSLSGSTYIGMVPVRTLGLPDSYASDPWSGKFTYAAASQLIGNPGNYNAALTAGPVVRYGDNTTYQVAFRAPVGSGTPGTGYASFVVMSHGPTGIGGYSTDGSSAIGTCGSSTIDSENCDGDNIFIDGAYNEGNQSAQFFDDYVVWGTNLPGLTAVATNYYSNAGTGANAIGCSNVTSTTPYCQAWCATCNTTAPPILPGSFTNPVLCSKAITASSSSCSAKCIWGGLITTGSKYQPCP